MGFGAHRRGCCSGPVSLQGGCHPGCIGLWSCRTCADARSPISSLGINREAGIQELPFVPAALNGLSEKLTSLPTDREIVVYCVYGHEVRRSTAMRLRAAGLKARTFAAAMQRCSAAAAQWSRAPKKPARGLPQGLYLEAAQPSLPLTKRMGATPLLVLPICVTSISTSHL